MKMILEFYKNLSIKWKFVSTYFTILILQIILSGIYLYIQTSNSTIDDAKSVMGQNLMQTRSSIIQKEQVIENISPIITYNKNLQNFIEQKYQNEAYRIEDYQFQFTPIMEDIAIQNNLINSIKIYMPNLIFTEMKDDFYSVSNEITPELYKKMLESKPLKNGWKETHEDYNSEDEFFSFSSEIMSSVSFKQIGVTEIEIKENVLFDTLKDPVIRKSGNIFIVDNKDTVVSSNVPKMFNKNIAATGVRDFVKYKKINKIETVNNVKSIVISIPIEGIDCSIVGVFPVSHFNSSVKGSMVKIIIILLISSLLFGVIIYLTTELLLVRVKTLIKAMKQVKGGNIDVSVNVESEDEFGELGSSFNHMTLRIHDLVETVYKIQIMERDAELKAFESQINPHFLYNTLATISWVARKKNTAEVVKITNSLAKFYRLVLSNGHTLISVKEEIDIVASYLYIQKIRFEDTLDVVYDIDEDIYNYRIIKNILQPIVENALKHGISNKRGHSTIIIKIKKYEDQLCFKIIDDGVGMSKNRLDEVLLGTISPNVSGGYAVNNIMERLRAYYGDDQSFQIFSRIGVGTVVTIKVARHLKDKFKETYTC